MAKIPETAVVKRLDINYFEGINSLVGANLAKKNELAHAENARSVTVGTIEKRAGTRRLGNAITATANYGIFYFENSGSPRFYRISKVSGATNIYYLSSEAVWTALTGEGAALTTTNGYNFSYALAEGCCFLVNKDDDNRYIDTNGTTVVDATSASGHLYGSPKARKVAYYKDRIYLADYVVGSTQYPNSIMMSSRPLGIVSLVDNDPTLPLTELDVTDTKYIRASDTLDVYRGDLKVGVLTVTAKTESKLTATIAYEAGFSTVLSSDELWISGTYTGTRKFRWAANPASGENVKQYDTFKLTGGQNSRIKMMEPIGDSLVISNNSNFAVWNDASLKNFDLGIGCVSDNGYVKALGTLFFTHYTGVYATTGGMPKLISAKVQRYFDGATKAGLEASSMGKKGLSIFVSLGTVTLYYPDGSVEKVLSDVVLEYNLRQENWYDHTGLKVTEFRTYPKTANADNLEFSSTETGYHIFEFLTGQLDDKVSDDKEIPFRVDIGKIVLASQREKICYVMEIIVEVERGSGIQAFLSLDDSRFYALKDEASKGCSVLKVHPEAEYGDGLARCRTINISLRDFTANLCKIAGISIIYAETNEEEDERPSTL